MYKNRIKAWRLKKYVKASEKEKIATFIKDNDIKGDTLRKLKFNGRPARLDLVRRYCKKTGAHEEIANALPTKALEEQLTRIGDRPGHEEAASHAKLPTPPGSAHRHRHSVSSAADITPTRSSVSDPAECVSWYVQQYFEWHLAIVPAESVAEEPAAVLANMAAFSTLQSDESASKVCTFLESLLLGLDKLIDHPSGQGWDLVHQACEQVKSVMADQHRSFLRFLVIGFTDPRWSSLPGLRGEMLRFLARMSAYVLGEDHDLSCILYLLQSEEVLESAAEPILRAMADVLARHRGPVDNETREVKLSLAGLLQSRNDFDGAAKLGNEVCLETNALQGPHHESTRTAIQCLADTHMSQGSPDIARGGYREVLTRSVTPNPSDPTNPPAIIFDEATIFSLHALCELDRSRATFKAKDLPFEHVLETVLTELGSSRADISSCLAAWCQPLTLRRRWLGSNRYSDSLLTRWAITGNPS